MKVLHNILIITSVLLLTGCSSMDKAITQSASSKNLNLSGYIMHGKIETANTETYVPHGELTIGRLSYKSRKVSIPKDQKVPTTGYFKATKTKSLFGTEEVIIEYDFTASSIAELNSILTTIKEQSSTAYNALTDKTEQAK